MNKIYYKLCASVTCRWNLDLVILYWMNEFVKSHVSPSGTSLFWKLKLYMIQYIVLFLRWSGISPKYLSKEKIEVFVFLVFYQPRNKICRIYKNVLHCLYLGVPTWCSHMHIWRGVTICSLQYTELWKDTNWQHSDYY